MCVALLVEVESSPRRTHWLLCCRSFSEPKLSPSLFFLVNDVNPIERTATATATTTTTASPDTIADVACALIANAEEVFRLALSECRTCPGRDHPFAATCLLNVARCAK